MADLIDLALIDDDEAVLDALRQYLTRQNVRTSCFKAAKNFLTTLDHQGRFDCIVSDVRMPGMSGLDLVQHLNGRSYARPVILITGHGDVETSIALPFTWLIDKCRLTIVTNEVVPGYFHLGERSSSPAVEACYSYFVQAVRCSGVAERAAFISSNKNECASTNAARSQTGRLFINTTRSPLMTVSDQRVLK